MARYFAGNTLAAFSRSTVATVEITTAGTFDSAYVPNSIAVLGVNEYIEPANMGSLTGTIWLRFDCKLGSAVTTVSAPLITLYNVFTDVFRIVSATSSTFKCQYWNGSAYVDTGTTWSTSTSRITFVVKVILGSGFELYSGGSLLTSGSSWSGGGTTVTKVRLYSPITSASASTSYAEVMMADYDIRNSHLMLSTLSGNSATNTGAASGVYGDVAETVLDESTAIAVSTTTNKAGATHNSITVPGGYVVAAMVVSARGRVSGGSITDGKIGIRSGGTNYSSSALSYDGGYSPRQYIASTDPATSATFTQSGFNAAEIYVEAN